jgi:phosphoribosylglycinamide formyltransferase 1
LSQPLSSSTVQRHYVVLVSGRGSNMKAILAASAPGQCVGVISNRADAGALTLAQEMGIPTVVVDHKAFASRDDFDSALADAVERFSPDLIVLAGFMRILGANFVDRFIGRVLNIHPSLLPAFPGVRTHARALAAGVSEHGCTVHLVTRELDAGPTLAQSTVPVMPGDDEGSLSARVLEQEHLLYPRVVQDWLAGKFDSISLAEPTSAP